MGSRNRKQMPGKRKEGKSLKQEGDLPGMAQGSSIDSKTLSILMGILGIVFLWSYWPVFTELVHEWWTQPDYTHGFLVIPVSLFLLSLRWDRRPKLNLSFSGIGLGLVITAITVRLLSNIWYLGGIQGWTIPLWIAGVVVFLGGMPLLRWSWTAIFFLFFMVPLPYSAEKMLSLPLQKVATKVSCWMLQTLGQPAVSEGNLILIREVPLSVEEACSGLAIFMSIISMAYLYMVIIQKPWWFKVLVGASILPVAIIANSTRIVLTGLLSVYFSGAAARSFSHDFSGIVMIFFAALLMGGIVWYLGKLFVQTRTVSTQELLVNS